LDITVVAPTFQRADRLQRLLVALEAQDHPAERYEVVVVDDGSTDHTADVVTATVERGAIALRPLRMERNGGPAPARNRGWRSATTPLVAFIDDDCTPEPSWVSSLVRAFERNDRLGVAQGHTRAAEGERGPWTVAREITYETPWFEGCNIAYRRDALEMTGGFDEDIGWYGEDTAAGWKVVEAGWERDFVWDAVVTHDLENRGIGWRIRHAWLEANLVELAARHPGLRQSGLWRRSVYGPASLMVLLALAGMLGSSRRPALAALAAPYLVHRRELLRRPVDLLACAAIDAVAVGGHVRGSLRSGVVVL
jgi:cellulose synthase/poly-beta-1,6-N-acetylglucosamine synthase-like glycosyltransferase